MTKPEIIKTNYLVIETAMAAYAVLEDTRLLIGATLPDDHPFKDAERQMSKYCDDYGAGGMRRAAWEMASLIESVWNGMTEDERDGAICWDFEFVPEFMLYCLNFTDEDVEPVIKGTEKLRALYRTSRERCKTFVSKCPPSTRERDNFIQDCRDEAEKQWKYADLISDYPDEVQRAFEAKEKPAEFVKALGEELELIDFGPWS
ncbi:hypothetical protein [Bradyrhizobium elkanii]|uniref:DUF4375 domain-containing protein n=1 Tax=Bradyrhizobium elkanii TaxID=29448 RepID=A0ABV4F1B3_BRAEL|nr:hypothetical protein [Bradyrhizobium elkanii]MCP1757791.1 hypothetical protein [Bradyrhizobium elkanii]MCS3881912.1 hypothetical protein [Bradyrhizobium elkanii]MCS4218672.1 hypothetical protein [Bradyrhizobium elkanii]MCW2110030.1 hypothetical protein [Bradyrhizobium elkanii]MCW2201599.1 hypothetical protein [Bradyrhizobium elkanii]